MNQEELHKAIDSKTDELLARMHKAEARADRAERVLARLKEWLDGKLSVIKHPKEDAIMDVAYQTFERTLEKLHELEKEAEVQEKKNGVKR